MTNQPVKSNCIILTNLQRSKPIKPTEELRNKDNAEEGSARTNELFDVFLLLR